MIAPWAPARISACLVAVPEVAPGVLNGLHEVSSFVGSGWEMLTGWPPGPARFQPRIVATDRAPFRNLAGLPIAPELGFAEVDALVCSVCTGSLMLAEAGLLEGEEATCHWAVTDQIRHRYPGVRLHPERVLAAAGVGHRLVTAGGSASWTDLALYLVARFCGEEEARRTARLFLFGDRSDGQLPFAARVRPRQHEDAAVAAAQLWIARNYDCAHRVAGMTQVSGLAPRTFIRRFQAATGYVPLDHVQSLRIEEAKQMLETSDAPIDAVAAEVGHTEPAAFRRVFKRATGIAPNQYRQRFRWMSAA